MSNCEHPIDCIPIFEPGVDRPVSVRCPICKEIAPIIGRERNFRIKEVTMAQHNDLVLRAEKWLNSINFKVTIRDPFRCANQEHTDAIGWKNGVSALIEVKVSRADFLSDKRKSFRIKPDQAMGDWRFYLCPTDIIKPDDLPTGWGLLYATDKTVRSVHGVPL